MISSEKIVDCYYSMGAANSSKMANDNYMSDLQPRLKQAFLEELCRRPNIGMTEVRRDGKDNGAISAVISEEFNRCYGTMNEADFMYHMKTFSSACWVGIFHVINSELIDFSENQYFVLS